MIKFYCTRCDKKLGVPDEFAGKMVKCSRCRQPTPVPELSPYSETDPAPEAVPKDTLSEQLVSTNLADSASAQDPSGSTDSASLPPPTESVQPTRIRCPKCNTLITNDTEFCVVCGCEISPQDDVEIESEAESPGRFQTLAQMPRFLILGSVAALVGMLIWIGIAYSTGKESGYAALLVGILVGFVLMVIGRNYRRDIGLLASAVTILAVPLGKYLTISWVEPPPKENTRINTVEINERTIDQSVRDHDTLFYITCRLLVEQDRLSNEAAISAMHYCLAGPLSPDQIPSAKEHCQKVTQTFRDWPLSKRKEVIREYYQKKAKKIQEVQQATVAAVNQAFYKDRLKFAFQDWYIDLLWYLLAVLAAGKIGASLNE